jgi:hypothetical protein
MPVAFDTYALITRLQQGQMPLAQAEAVSAALQEALEESIGTLATKADIADVRKDLDALGADLRKDLTQLINRLSWMIGVNMTLTLLILGKLLLFKA